jgi:hypothetical protein
MIYLIYLSPDSYFFDLDKSGLRISFTGMTLQLIQRSAPDVKLAAYALSTIFGCVFN